MGDRAAPVAQWDEEISAGLARFQERESEAQRHFLLVVRNGVRIMSCGAAIYVLGIVVVQVLNDASGYWLNALGISLCCCGATLCSTCPTDRLDLDRLSRGAAVALALAMGCVGLSAGFRAPHVHTICVLPAVCMAVRAVRCAPWTPFACLCLMSWIAGDGATWALNPKVADAPLALQAVVSMAVLLGLPVAAYAWHHHHFESRTKSLFMVLYIYLCCSALAFSVEGIVSLRSALIFDGFVRLGPMVLVLVFGPKHLFQWTARRLDTDPQREQRDGAYMASLIQVAKWRVGDVYWIHRKPGQEDTSRPVGDAQRNWLRGTVVHVGLEELQVQLPEAPGDGSQSEIVPIGFSCADPSALIALGRQNLRCMNWEKVTADLITGTVCGGDDRVLASNGYFGLSRPVRPGEVIDFFISNSWHDDAARKWLRLKEQAEDFQRTHGRSFTLWLDKTCIDQHRIRDGLQVLPINVMACSSVMVLWGPSYPRRLWCVWELFVVLAFSSAERAAERLLLVPLHGSREQALDELRRFRAGEAKCYDPNERCRLMHVISAVGEERFNRRLHALAETLTLRQEAGALRSRSHGIARLLSRAKSAQSKEPRTIDASQNAVSLVEGHGAHEPATVRWTRAVDSQGVMWVSL